MRFKIDVTIPEEKIQQVKNKITSNAFANSVKTAIDAIAPSASVEEFILESGTNFYDGVHTRNERYSGNRVVAGIIPKFFGH